MRNTPSNLVLAALRDQISRLDGGDRLPTVRELMSAHRVGQGAVQEALTHLREEGLISSQVGRGTYVLKGNARTGRPEPARSPRLDSLLILSNASLNERCVLVQNHILGELMKSGSKVVQIAYHDTEHLLEILTSIPNFDAVILQSHYESIPIRLLHLLQSKTRALVVDGHTVSGVDIDRIGTDWEEALDIALEHLSALGHRSVGLVALDSTAQPIASVMRAFERIGRRDAERWREARPIVLRGVHHPTLSVSAALGEALGALRAEETGKLPFTALVTLGISDVLGMRQCLGEMGIAIPRDLSVFVLGHHDVPTEHLGVMSIAGSSHLQAAQELMKTIHRRLLSPNEPPQIIYLDCVAAIRESTDKL